MPRVVIAEDDELVAELIRFKLEKRGYEVSQQADGEALLPELLASPPDLLILDYQLSSISAAELLDRLAREQATADMPLIILSSAWREQDVLEVLESGISDFITKPFSPDELMLRVDLALRRAGKPAGALHT